MYIILTIKLLQTKVIKDPNIRGAIIAPAVYGALLLISSLCSLYLPETNNRSLPVTVEEATANIDRLVNTYLYTNACMYLLKIGRATP